MDKADVADQLARLANAFARPFGTTARGQTIEYYAALSRDKVRLDELHAAVDELIRTATKFPEPAQVREAIAAIRRERRAAAGPPRPSEAPPVCDQCGRAFFYAGFELPNGTVLPRRRCACRPVGSGWQTERAKAWRETDPALLGEPSS